MRILHGFLSRLREKSPGFSFFGLCGPETGLRIKSARKSARRDQGPSWAVIWRNAASWQRISTVKANLMIFLYANFRCGLYIPVSP